MGLDVNLYRYTQDRAKVAADKAALEAVESAAWDFNGKPYQDLTDDEKEQACAKVDAAKAELGYEPNSYDHPGLVSVDAPSAKFPDHTFRVGYFRSSYNGGGINNVLHRQGLMDLYGIFGVGRDYEYEFAPDWQASRERAVQTLKALRAKSDGLDITEVTQSLRPFDGDEAAVLDHVRAELAREHTFEGGYSNANGSFFPQGRNVVAWVYGKPGFLGTGVYIVTKTEDVDDWYASALEVVIETIDYVLAQPDPENYVFHWSA